MKTNYKKQINDRIDEVVEDPSFIESSPKAKVNKPFPKWGKISLIAMSSAMVATAVTLSIVLTIPKQRLVGNQTNNGTSTDIGNKTDDDKPNQPIIDNNDKVTVEVSTFQASNKNINNIDTAVADLNSLNNIVYPTTRISEEYTATELSDYLTFANTIFKQAGNKSYSPLTLYQVLNGVKDGISDVTLKEKMSQLLGANINVSDLAVKMFKNNYYYNDNGTTQIHNGAFYNTDIENITYNQDYVDKLTDYYFETYNLSYKNDSQKMVDWVNKALNSGDMIDESFLEMNKDSFLYLFSAMYFNHFWENKYISDLNKVGDFLLANNEVVQATYMKHSYRVDSYYEYDKYISFDDFYCNGNKVTFLLPKTDTEEDILELVKDKNFLVEDEENKVNRPYDEETGQYKNIYITLKTPKFEQETELTFNDTLKTLGFSDLFNDTLDYMSGVANDPYDLYNVFISKVKQKNVANFNEDGSYVTSLAEVSMEAGASAPPQDVYLDISLSRPFIYIIKDQGNLPLYIGYMDNPTK